MQKVKVSGGGRCNTTHQLFDIPELLTRYPRGKALLRNSLRQFTTENTIDWFAERNVVLKAESDGRMFPVSDDSQTIIDCIYREMQNRKVAVHYQKSLTKIEKNKEHFELHFQDKTIVTADAVLIACGGFPKLSQYDWLAALGHEIFPPAPSLFTFNLRNHSITQLMGVSVPNATVKIAGTKIMERGPVLITHWGLSGPAILRASAWGARELQSRNYDFEVMINWLGNATENDVKGIIAQQRISAGKALVTSKNPFDLPRRLWEYLAADAGATSATKWGELTASVQNKIVQSLTQQRFPVSGKTTYKEEFVTCGGISLSEVDTSTMQSKLHNHLYFAGEILDVDGITGGFNFQHAWASGFVAAKAIASHFSKK